MTQLEADILTCVGCDQRATGQGKLPCKVNGKHYIDNCLKHSCPLGFFRDASDSKAFVAEATPADPALAAAAAAERAPAGEMMVSPMTIVGPRLWAELHRRPLEVAENELAADGRPGGWLGRFAAKLPCGDCREHWLELLAATPPRLESRAAYARWTWEMHDAVNERLGKPRPSYDEMATIYRWPADPVESDSAPIGLAPAELRRPDNGPSSDM